MSAAPIVAVRGEATLQVPPEIARLTVTVAARDPDRRAVLTRLTQRLEAVRAVLDGYAEAVERRETGHVQVRPELKRTAERKRGGERVSGYAASLATTVTFTDFTALGEALLRVADEEHTSVYGPSWALRADSPVYRQARRAAVDDAVVRAHEYADAVGSRVDRLLSLTDAGMSAAPPVPMAFAARTFGAADAGPELDLEPQSQSAHAAVEMRFTITEPTALAGRD
jgi:uncharacterized protein YggE